MRLYLYDAEKDTSRRKPDALSLGNDSNDGRTYIEWPLVIRTDDENGHELEITVKDGMVEIRNNGRRGIGAIKVSPHSSNVVRIGVDE